MADNPSANFEMPVPFGVDADTGKFLDGVTPEAIEWLASSTAVEAKSPDSTKSVLESRADPSALAFAVSGDYDANDLSQVGWGIIFPANAQPGVKEALKPLLDLRQKQVTTGGTAPFKIYEGAEGYQPGMTARQWLAARGVSLNIVDPALGVPFFLLLVGTPDEIPFEFQYQLDIFWAVGRLQLAAPEDYAQYAKSIVAYETAAAVPNLRQLAVFAPEHEFDKATQMFNSMVAKPLVDGIPPWGKIGQRQKFGIVSYLADDAKKGALADILRGKAGGGPPALLLSGSHGMSFRADDARQPGMQGALVCSDWEGSGPINEKHWFAAQDVPADAKVQGLIHFFFACFGAGCPQFDNFNRMAAAPKQIAPKTMLARLPQALLAHKNGGALATLAHVDRAWAYSFVSDRGGAQLQGFRDVIGRLLRGDRVGQATDQFNVRWAALSTELSDSLQDKQLGKQVADAELASRWVARDDARNYIIFGDPAVRLRVEDMPELK